jgi:hypothetical protein
MKNRPFNNWCIDTLDRYTQAVVVSSNVNRPGAFQVVERNWEIALRTKASFPCALRGLLAFGSPESAAGE